MVCESIGQEIWRLVAAPCIHSQELKPLDEIPNGTTNILHTLRMEDSMNSLADMWGSPCKMFSLLEIITVEVRQFQPIV